MNEQKIVRIIAPIIGCSLLFGYYSNPDAFVNFITANQIPIGIVGGVGFVGLSFLASKQTKDPEEKARLNSGIKTAYISLAVALAAIGLMFWALQGQLHSLMETAGSIGK